MSAKLVGLNLGQVTGPNLVQFEALSQFMNTESCRFSFRFLHTRIVSEHEPCAKTSGHFIGLSLSQGAYIGTRLTLKT